VQPPSAKHEKRRIVVGEHVGLAAIWRVVLVR
jgi:hypothetical protein